MCASYKLAAAVAMAGLASTHAFAPSGALLGLSRQSTGLALARHGPRPSPRPSLRSVGAVRMEAKVTTKEIDGQVEFMGVDGNGNPVTLSLAAREKLYLDAVTSFYIDGSKLISDEDYEQLRNDLAFEGSNVGMMSRDEIKFMVSLYLNARKDCTFARLHICKCTSHLQCQIASTPSILY